MRKYLRQVAKARLRAIGVDRVNKRMNAVAEGETVWRKVLADPAAHNAQAKGKRAVLLKKKVRATA